MATLAPLRHLIHLMHLMHGFLSPRGVLKSMGAMLIVVVGQMIDKVCRQ